MPEEEQQQGQQPPGQGKVRMPQVNYNMLAGDDYAYEPKPLPAKPFEESQDQQQGGMASQFEIVSSQLNKNL